MKCQGLCRVFRRPRRRREPGRDRVEDWGGGSFCSARNTIITFYSPTDGAPVPNNGVDNGADLELLGVETDLLLKDGERPQSTKHRVKAAEEETNLTQRTLGI